jgi:Tol biopolymer transport system component
MPDVEQALSVIVDIDILSFKIVNTIKGLSSEGKNLTGRKAAVEMQLKQKVLYAADIPGRSIHVVEDEYYHGVSVVIPTLINGTDPEVLVKYKCLKPRVRIDETEVRWITDRLISRSIHAFLELYLVPVYELCSSIIYSDDGNRIFICHADGSHGLEAFTSTGGKIINPSWSPGGQEIAFLSGIDGKYGLYILNTKNSQIKSAADPLMFKTVSSYCWSADGKNIFFSSSAKGNKEIFMVEPCSLKWRQLSFGNSGVKSYKPKCSPDGNYIAFIKSVSGITYLYVMDTDGLNCKKVSESTGIKDFYWSCGSPYLAYICSKGGRADEVHIAGMEGREDEVIDACSSITQKRSVKCSTRGNMIAFIGSCDLCTDNIFVYDIDQGSLTNATQSFTGSRISDYSWNAGSSKIFYASNELAYYNIYSVSLHDYSRSQITNTIASDIELDCRCSIK